MDRPVYRVDHDALHLYLWRHSDSRDVATFKNVDMAEMLGITQYSMSRTLREMSLAGRVAKVGPRRWKIKDPAVWRWSDQAWAKQKPRVGRTASL